MKRKKRNEWLEMNELIRSFGMEVKKMDGCDRREQNTTTWANCMTLKVCMNWTEHRNWRKMNMTLILQNYMKWREMTWKKGNARNAMQETNGIALNWFTWLSGDWNERIETSELNWIKLCKCDSVEMKERWHELNDSINRRREQWRREIILEACMNQGRKHWIYWCTCTLPIS